MRSIKVLELIDKGKIEELKAALQEEIYTESLKSKPNAKKRYSAMKKYFTYADSVRDVCQKPCPIEFEGVKYSAFTNSYSLVLTTESTGEMELFDDPKRYPDVTRLIHFSGTEEKIDFKKVLAEAKTKGYKLRKSELFSNRYLTHIGNGYFRIALLDSSFGIIDDGEEATVYRVESGTRPITIKTSIGICVIMPVRYEGTNPEENGNVVIETSKEVMNIEPEEIAELITRRRRQILVHSIIYYKFNDNLVSDSQWSKWAVELADLQNRFPDIADTCIYNEEFQDFDGSTGFNLPMNDPWGTNKALQLIRYRDNQQRSA